MAAFAHQDEALAKMLGRENFALLMAMRTGKTKVILDEFGTMELDGRVSDLLVVAPGGAYRTWVQAMEDHLSVDLRSRIDVHVWRSGKPAGRREFLASTDRPRALLMNVEALSRPGEARQTAIQFLARGRNVVVIDESTVIKNNSKRTQFVLRQIRPLATYRRVLSGLATPRSPLDLYYQFAFLTEYILGFNSWHVFRSVIAHVKTEHFGGRSVQVVNTALGDRGFRRSEVEAARRRIEPHSYRIEFRPKMPSTYTFRDVDLTPEQQAAYSDMRAMATHALSATEHVTATVVIAQLIRMHQILLGHVRDESGAEHVLPENRTAALLELMEDYAGKAIVWCSYDHDVRKVSKALAEEYGPRSVARFWGGNTATREDEEKKFVSEPECRFMVATPSAGGRGRTWHVADLVVYYSNTDNLEHRDQSEQRAMGMTKSRQVDFVDMIVRGTVEEKIINSLRSKIDMASIITGDNYKEWLV
jgi:hypothetical protein